MNFLVAVQCYISFTLEDYDELHVYISGAFLSLGVKPRTLKPEEWASKYCRSVLSWEQLLKHVEMRKMSEVVHLHCAGVGFQMEAVVLTLESACFFWWMQLFCSRSEQRLESDLAKGESRDWRQLFLEEEMHSGSLLGRAALLYVAPVKKKNSLKMLSEHPPEGWVLGCKERAGERWQR